MGATIYAVTPCPVYLHVVVGIYVVVIVSFHNNVVCGESYNSKRAADASSLIVIYALYQVPALVIVPGVKV